ncbi:hypothetical protein P9112_013326 [Eukaryota sp. TZLM1-RC]
MTLRTKSTLKRLKMYRSKVKVDPRGKVIGGAFMSSTPSTDGRILPNRKWFGNTRVVGQNQLSQFREAIEATNSPYSVLLRQRKLPLSLVSDSTPSSGNAKILDIEPYDETFGATRRRKRAKINASSLEELAASTLPSNDSLVNDTLPNPIQAEEEDKFIPEPAFDKGTSKRIWGELFRVVDSSDVIIQVLDARDPIGTRSQHLERMLKRPEHKHRHLVLLINKVDLVPVSCTRQYVKLFSSEYPCLAFKASVEKPFGKGSLVNLLRQFAKLHHDKPQISVGFVGYPNVGKSSVINALKGKKAVNVAPIPGETKFWQFVTLMKRIYLIDCPGTIGLGAESPETAVLKGAIRTELIPDPVAVIPLIFDRVNNQHLIDLYDINQWTDYEDFLSQIAFAQGKLLKGGEPDINITARIVLNDFLRGKIAWFVKPPNYDDNIKKEKGKKVKNQNDDVIDDVTGQNDEVSEEESDYESEETVDWDDVFDADEVQESDTDDEFDEQETVGAPDEREVEISQNDDDSQSEAETIKSNQSEGHKEGSISSDSEESQEESETKQTTSVPIVPLKRMTTNKKKVGNHFYDRVDVRNRRKGGKKVQNKRRRM